MRLRTEAVVLRTAPFGEADLIVTFLTQESGIRKGFAKSPRKVGSRFGASLEPLTEARITLTGREDAELPRLTQSDIIRPHQALREELRCFALASSMAELTLALLPEGAENKEVYALLTAMLTRMDAGCTEMASLIYRIRLLHLKGYAPRLISCGRCGAEATGFHIPHGSVLCGRCARGAALEDDVIMISPGAARLYETLRTWDLDKTSRIKAGAALLQELGILIRLHSEHLAARPMRADRFHAGQGR